nr:MAG TPA: hypothetical protein [Herelleviridae sp.]
MCPKFPLLLPNLWHSRKKRNGTRLENLGKIGYNIPNFAQWLKNIDITTKIIYFGIVLHHFDTNLNFTPLAP